MSRLDFDASTTAAVQACIGRVLRPAIQSIASYSVAAPLQGAIKLDAMECPYGLPDGLREQVAQAVAGLAFNRYPSADPGALRDAVRAALGVPDDAGLMFGNGSDELIHLVVQACCEPGDRVLSPAPSFVYYQMAAAFDHARFVGVDLTADLELDLPAMLEAIERYQPKVVFLAVPNNPTGGLWSTADIEAILAAAPGLVVIDEAYQPFAGITWMPRLNEFPNLVVMRTVSKIGLAGLRLGYLAAHPAWVCEFDKVRPPYNLNVLTEAAATIVLRNIQVLEQQAAQLVRDRAVLSQGLAALPGVRVWPSSANFVLARLPDAARVHAELKARRILVRFFGQAHPLLSDCLRISVGTPHENAACLQALSEILNAASA
jgi:histidinol-phosphate aminotransferase